MSDPVTNVEIEDVLSSIRRLVSVDSARARRAPAGVTAQPPAAPISKLVLTEDYRIVPDQPVAAETGRDRTVGPASDYTRTLERRIAELEAAVTAQATEFEPDGSEDTSQHRPTSMLFTSVKPASRRDGALELADLVADAVPDKQAESPLPETEEPVSDGQQAPDDDVTPEPAPNPVQQEAQVEPDAMWADEDEALLFRSAHDSDRVEVLEAETYRTADMRSDEGEFRFSNDDTLIDEDTLRDMVAEIVRDELQGALGERITRNVRKLVRREIMRAISIRDFE